MESTNRGKCWLCATALWSFAFVAGCSRPSPPVIVDELGSRLEKGMTLPEVEKLAGQKIPIDSVYRGIAWADSVHILDRPGDQDLLIALVRHQVQGVATTHPKGSGKILTWLEIESRHPKRSR
jgi:hypothetical protein